MEFKREALRQTWISQRLDRYKVSADSDEVKSIISQVDIMIAKLTDEEVDYFI